MAWFDGSIFRPLRAPRITFIARLSTEIDSWKMTGRI